MRAESVAAAIAYIGMTAFFLALLWRHRVASPIFWYPVSLALISLGIFFHIEFKHKSDGIHILMNFLSALCFLIIATAYAHFRDIDAKLKRFKRKSIQPDAPHTKIMVSALFVLCIALTSLYFAITGQNMIVMALTTGIEDDYSTIRLAMYAGDVYTAAGYFNQFKNFLLPLTSALIAHYMIQKNKNLGFIVSVVVVIVCGLAVAGAGQRTYLVYSSLATLFGFLLLNLGRPSLIGWRTVLFSILLFVAFSMMTMLYKVTASGILEPMRLALERIFLVQQRDGLVAFQFMYDRPIVWLEEWIASFLSLVPGHRGSGLANEIHDFIFDSSRGTSPPTLVGSAYYNGGPILVALTFSFLGLLYSGLYEAFLSGSKTPARCLGYGALFFYLVTFFVGNPKYLLDNGVMAFVFFLILRRFLVRSHSNSRR